MRYVELRRHADNEGDRPAGIGTDSPVVLSAMFLTCPGLPITLASRSANSQGPWPAALGTRVLAGGRPWRIPPLASSADPGSPQADDDSSRELACGHSTPAPAQPKASRKSRSDQAHADDAALSLRLPPWNVIAAPRAPAKAWWRAGHHGISGAMTGHGARLRIGSACLAAVLSGLTRLSATFRSRARIVAVATWFKIALSSPAPRPPSGTR